MSDTAVLIGVLIDDQTLTLDELACACGVEADWLSQRLDAGLLTCCSGEGAARRSAYFSGWRDVTAGEPASINIMLDSPIQRTMNLVVLSRAKEDDRPLVKFWFKYGLLLCALGMLKEQQEQAEKKGGDGNGEGGGGDITADDLSRVNSYCNGIASVIIPIIRTLYRGPEFVGAS